MFQSPEAIDQKSVVMEVDGVDVTMVARVDNGRVSYVPGAPLKHGEHKVKITANARDGSTLAPLEWSFKIRRFSIFEEASLSGELSATYEGALRKPKKEPSPGSGVSHKTETPVHNLQSNLSVRGLLKEGEFTGKLDANIRYADNFKPQARPKEDTEKLDIANYLIGLDRKPLTFELGDILVNEGFYGAPSLSRRGMHLVAKDESLGVMAHLFGTRYETTSGHDPFFGPEEGHSLIWGGAIGYSPFSDKEALRLHVMNVKGHRYSSSPGANVGTIVAGEEGDLWSFGTSSSFANGRFKILSEIAFSEFDTNTTDEFHEQADKAWRVRLEGQEPLFTLFDGPVAMRWGGEYSRVGFAFRSPANPGLQADRDGWSVKSDTTWKIVTVTLGYAAFHDNLDLLATLPRVRTFVWNGGIALAPPDLPSVAFNYNRSDQRSFYEPESHGGKGVDNLQDTYTLTTGLSREQWSANITLTANFFDEKRPITIGTTGGDRDTYTTQGSFSYKPLPPLTITPSLTWTVIDEKNKQTVLGFSGEQTLQRVRTESLTGTLGVAHEIIAQVLNLDVQLSGASSQSSDGLQDNQVWSGVGRITWNLGKLFWDYGKQAVSLRVNWNRTLDHVVPRDTNEIGVFVILDLLAPYNL
ncbi:MAG TPA: hypothetical protein VGT02_12055 [Methylomirabilota bacterium]|jgi:hypothetical protein|nr:hypothetical protein [Methylomirabilota bacterium]